MTDSLIVSAKPEWMQIIENQKSVIDSLKTSNHILLTNQADLFKAVKENSFALDNLWIIIATALVFIMHLGFATLESGLTRSKNTINILFKNTFIPLVGIIGYYAVGMGLMFPHYSEESLAIVGFNGFGVELNPTSSLNLITKFLFQAMFAATCATIVSGAVAERIKLNAFMIFSALFVTFVYPIIASWEWGEGWLYRIGFRDFAGSTLVHSVGGWAALAGVIILGPRYGRYEKGRIIPIQGHSMTSAVIGVFMLWLGWFGFNGGSVLSVNPELLSSVIANTTLSACMGGLAATYTIKFIGKRYDLSMSLNGILAGLVGITAGADVMCLPESLLIGSVAGVLVVFSVLLFDRIKIDDPVGAISVHLVCGIWGTLAVGLLGKSASSDQFLHQAFGIACCGITAFGSAILIFTILKYTIGLRVDKEEEIYGLDYAEHGMEAYPDFVSK
ncbi:MAG: ammonium transporter [Cytophagales bacterium]